MAVPKAPPSAARSPEKRSKSAKAKAPAGAEARPGGAPGTSRAGTIALVGRPNVGKSTLLNALLGERIAITSPHPQTTRDRIAGVLTLDDVQYVFLDTPGVHTARHKLGERMNDLALAAAADSDVAIFMTDVEVRGVGEAASIGLAVREDDRAILRAIPEGTPTLLLLNKVDRVKPKSLLFPLLEALGKERDFAAVVPVSALKGDGTRAVLAEVAKLLPEGEPLYDPEELSDKPVRFFVSEFVREQILKRIQKEVPHGVAVTVEAFDEGQKLVRISVTIHVAKDSHKGILIGGGGKMLASIGTAARRRAEGLLGRQVHLETFVRSTPGWFDDAARLADMGYTDGVGARKKAPARRPSRPNRPNRPNRPKAQPSERPPRGARSR